MRLFAVFNSNRGKRAVYDRRSKFVAIDHFENTQFQGPMWRLIRGQGLSYGYNMYPKLNEGLLYLTLSTATNAVAAYKEMKSIVV